MPVVKALLLAGGFGTRLRPLTYTRPKHLLPIYNRPHIEHVLDLLQRYGVADVVLTTSYLAEAFRDTAAGAVARGMNVEVTHEEVPLGTAGALKNAEAVLGSDTFLVFNGDILTDVDLDRLTSFHRQKGAEATILLTPVEDPSAFGVVSTDHDGRVVGFVEKPSPEEAPTNLINAGVYVLEPSVLGRVPEGQEWSVERALFPELVAERARLFATQSSAYWIDVGTPEKYLQANLDAIDARLKLEGGAAIDPSARIDASAAVSSSCLGPGTVVGRAATVTDCVLLAGVAIGAGACLKDCILGEGVRVAPGVDLRGETVGDFQEIG